MNEIMGWKAECDEWQAIAKEGVEVHVSLGIMKIRSKYQTAFEVSLEQRKRMLARGQRPMTYYEIVSETNAEKAIQSMYDSPLDAINAGVMDIDGTPTK